MSTSSLESLITRTKRRNRELQEVFGRTIFYGVRLIPDWILIICPGIVFADIVCLLLTGVSINEKETLYGSILIVYGTTIWIYVLTQLKWDTILYSRLTKAIEEIGF